MNTLLGEKGLALSHQAPFKEKETCKKCGGEARIMFVAREEFEKEGFVCELRKNGGEGDYWVHDAIAVALYLCKDCFEPVAVMNQA